MDVIDNMDSHCLKKSHNIKRNYLEKEEPLIASKFNAVGKVSSKSKKQEPAAITEKEIFISNIGIGEVFDKLKATEELDNLATKEAPFEDKAFPPTMESLLGRAAYDFKSTGGKNLT